MISKDKQTPWAALSAGHGHAGFMSEGGHEDDDGHDHGGDPILGTNDGDLIETGGGPQVITSGNGDDTIRAGGGPDRIHAGNGKDLVEGEGGPDVIDGGNGMDLIDGGCGPDSLDGGNGKDVLIGSMAPDTLTGGLGADVFVYRSASEAAGHGAGEDGGGGHDDGGEDGGGHDGGGGDGCAGGGVETITDFQPGLDRIDLSAIGTVSGLADAVAAFSIWLEQQGEDTIVRIDTDGNLAGEHPEDMTILLLGVEVGSLGIDDFIL